MVLHSHAKINLSLLVKKKLSNGLHDLQSIYCLINLKDKITIKEIKNQKIDKIFFDGPYSKDVNKSNNSIKKILQIMRKFNLISNYYSVKVIKNIPAFSGLGGGTSNAAIILKSLIKKSTKDKFLKKITKFIGSDLILFFNDQGYLKNLNTVDKLQKKHKLYFLLAYPNIKCSTKKIFSKVRKYTNRKNFSSKNLKEKSNFIKLLNNSTNDLQLIVEKKYPVIKKLLIFISKIDGCYFSRMTGSGSTCYGLFNSEKSSKAALKKLRKKYPKFSFSIAKTI